MPKERVTHFNPIGPTFDGITRCGRKLKSVIWTTDSKDVTCNNCNRLLRKEK